MYCQGDACTSPPQINTSALAAHPARSLFISGSLSGHVFLWRYNSDLALSAFTPAARSDASTQAPMRHPGGHNSILATWGTATAIQFSNCGERFLGIGSGGIVATWRLEMGRRLSLGDGSNDPDPRQLGAADWSHPCFSKARLFTFCPAHPFCAPVPCTRHPAAAARGQQSAVWWEYHKGLGRWRACARGDPVPPASSPESLVACSL